MILGIESSGTTGGVALLDAAGLRATVMATSRALYSQRLLPSIDWALQRAQASLADVHGIAVALGPGSFTGVRVGLSTAKGLALAHRLPIVGIPTLEALAMRAAVAGLAPRICTVLDARQGLLYAALFEVGPPAPDAPSELGALPTLRPLRAACACTRTDVLSWIDQPTVFAGDAALRFRREWHEALGACFILPPAHRVLPSAEEVALLGAARLAQGPPDDLAALEPIYLRRSYTEPRPRS
jgi:tRNA threonylcarbamoyladenosine biosynthesis protein TsaB